MTTFSFPINRTKSNQRWMKLRTTVQLSSAIQKKPPLKREDSFLKRFSTRQIPETQVMTIRKLHFNTAIKLLQICKCNFIFYLNRDYSFLYLYFQYCKLSVYRSMHRPTLYYGVT